MNLMGSATLATNASITVEEAVRLQETLFSEFSVLKKFIDENMQYPLDHNGYLRTLLGDTLKSDKWKYLRKPNGQIDRGTEAQIKRHGINN